MHERDYIIHLNLKVGKSETAHPLEIVLGVFVHDHSLVKGRLQGEPAIAPDPEPGSRGEGAYFSCNQISFISTFIPSIP